MSDDPSCKRCGGTGYEPGRASARAIGVQPYHHLYLCAARDGKPCGGEGCVCWCHTSAAAKITARLNSASLAAS